MELDKELIARKRLEQIEMEKEECSSIRKQLAQMEEEFSDQNKRIKAVNDELFERYPGNSKLQNILLQKEEGLRQKRILENHMLEDCRDEISHRMQELEKEKDMIEEDLRKGEEQNENNNNVRAAAGWTSL
ncbi:MAG: hypothetical protein Q4D94_13400 [Bacillota bacterium]|nr:hypothetical protein [Bacillota bacterium]